jgi:hypothetical protein
MPDDLAQFRKTDAVEGNVSPKPLDMVTARDRQKFAGRCAAQAAVASQSLRESIPEK